MIEFVYDIYFNPIDTDYDEPQYKDIKTFTEAERIVLESERTDLCIIQRLGDRPFHKYNISGLKWDESKVGCKFKVGDIVVCHKEKYSDEYGKEFEVFDVKQCEGTFIPSVILINTCGQKQWVNSEAFMFKCEWGEYLEFLRKYNENC